jgi:acetylornithine/succinyldiaminopimelate/putrescine aminotransferase
LCAKNKVLLIVDETLTGIYRTGKSYCFNNYDDFKPDGIIIGKIIASSILLLHEKYFKVENKDNNKTSIFLKWQVCMTIPFKVSDISFAAYMLQNVRIATKYGQTVKQVEKIYKQHIPFCQMFGAIGYVDLEKCSPPLDFGIHG